MILLELLHGPKGRETPESVQGRVGLKGRTSILGMSAIARFSRATGSVRLCVGSSEVAIAVGSEPHGALRLRGLAPEPWRLEPLCALVCGL
eukprot:scaffold72117_cov33-Phaeocystis_antarctica.AAC.2